MPEIKDTKNTTDQGRSGGRQTQEPNRPGEGEAPTPIRDAETQNRKSAGHGIDGGYGKGPAEGGSTQGAAARPQRDDSLEAGGSRVSGVEEEKRRTMGMDSNQEDGPAQEWSPGSDQPNT